MDARSTDTPALPPARSSLKSFGPFVDGIGARLVEWASDRAVIELDVGPQHINGTGVFHGGCMSALLDTALAHAAIYCTVPGNYRSGATVTLSANFVGPVRLGSRITVTARKVGGGQTIFMSAAEAVDETGRVVATGQAVGRYRDGSGVPEGMPRPPGTVDGRSPQRFAD